ncbi:MAG: CPXCG motif-containing cysteine-rich protein [Rhodanobacter sp.]
MLAPSVIACPYCGESIELLVDVSIPDQQYIEDCQVCCRPITLTIHVEDDGEVQMRAAAENDA